MDRESRIRQLETHNLLALSAYSVLLRFAWIFKTESVIIPAALQEKESMEDAEPPVSGARPRAGPSPVAVHPTNA